MPEPTIKFLGKTFDEAVESFTDWRRMIIAGNPRCPKCYGARGWEGIRTNYNGGGDVTGYDLVICCGIQVESDTTLIFRRLQVIERELGTIEGHIAQQSFIIRTAETSILEAIKQETTQAVKEFKRSTVKGILTHLWSRIRRKP